MDYYITGSGAIMNVVSQSDHTEYHDFQLLTWTEDREIPRKTYWTRQPQKISKRIHAPIHAPINRFNQPFRKHLFRVGKSKK